MFKVSHQVEDDVLKELAEIARTAPTKVSRMVGQIARGPIAQAMIRDLSKEPRSPSGKKRWTSDRQRRFVMAKLRRENNLPYKRSHKLSQGWRVVVVASERAEISVENSSREARFVQGDDAQPMHLATGWPQAAPIVQRYREPIEDALIVGWYRICGAVK